jgi:hypothetical protein
VTQASDAARELHVGQHVRAMSSWEGYVSEISDEEACGQGRLVTCHPITLPAMPEGGRPWKPITVTESELTPTGKPDRG